ncbi:hypothetical protein GOP47_0002191 [Adiantum capillus-veneris]|uniref:Pentatricopeptide repeat-containing protein n=1 Tax=Adiantum capillus-veneris TaxID=13818 RepID=A0A9D4ZNU5_ADICA|nr:hypothetical protein GOP47_0002191 [Adiantum capillus-veneris]
MILIVGGCWKKPSAWHAKCDALQKAQKVLEEVLVRNVDTWNALIAGYAKQGHVEEGMGYFQRMQSEDISPDEAAYAFVLKACGTMQDNDMCKRILDDIVNKGLLRKNIMLGTALVDMYDKCGALQKAQKLLEELPVRDVLSWIVPSAGYTQQGQG